MLAVNEIKQGTGSGFVFENDASLVEAAKDGDSLAFEILTERHRRMIFSSALRIMGNPEDAEDVVQQSLHNAIVHLKEFEGRSSFSTWLMRIAINEALMLRRSGRRRREISIDESIGTEESTVFLEIADSSPDPERTYSDQEQHRLLSSAISELRPGMRMALQFCDLNERSVRETAQILGVSVSAVKSRVHRGRKVLREKLKRHVAS